MLSKLSILLTYRHVNPDKFFRLAIYVLLLIILGYTLATTFITTAGCKPTDPTKADCIATLALAQAIANIPIPMIHNLQLPIGQRVIVGLVLAGGSFVVVASIVRLVIIQRLPGKVDFTLEQAKVCNWSSIEIMVGIMCQSIVTLKPLAKQYLPKMLGYGSDRSALSFWNKFFTSRGRSHAGRGRSRGNSLPLDSVDRGVTVSKASKANREDTETQWPEVVDGDDIVITSTYRVESVHELRSKSTESTQRIIQRTENGNKAHGRVEMV
ncbi:hypothetical protein DBV05_g9803 [Lasiodiplodia theobromae]|uniref:Rhodopsin domain-containing protein n=1 Tax=Lasiodiplodia theobromae TaxID=45133 RepID=A0A5N5D1W0_9PEZI|nr:hypothetical protein DBV05_g9803 [Lasiodiplodia theobromae]